MTEHTAETPPIPARGAIELWFDFGSNYSYLSAMRIETAAARRGVDVHWRPFLLGPIFRALGWETSPFVLQKQKGAYVWIDMARRCKKYDLAWTRPTRFPRAAVLPSRVALLGAREPWIGEFCRRIMTLNFAADRDIDSPAVVGDVLDAMGLSAPLLLAQAVSDANKQALRDQTEAARARGIFGAPTLFVGDEMFWGDDRLDDALAHCTRAAPTEP
jgi:2-hydroxychromene-2-carboxylate isomerase